MNLHHLGILRQQLITIKNPEWKELVHLRNIVKDEFQTQGYLSPKTYNLILNWKLRKQRFRTEKHRKSNTDNLIREITGTFWRVQHEDDEKQLEIKLKVLMVIPGVGLGVASAILTLSAPENFAIIDFRNWKVLYGEIKRIFTMGEYKKYLRDLRQLALQLDCDVQEVDYLLWKQYE